jgi:hypothetical protein
LPLGLASLVGFFGIEVGNQTGAQVTGIMSALLASLPTRVPFRNTLLPDLPPPPDFPAIVFDWRSLGVIDSSIVGTGTTSLIARDQSMVAMIVGGSRHIVGYQDDLTGGVGQTYHYALANFAPDANRFAWQVSGTGSDGGPIDIVPFDQGGSFTVDFPLPLKVKPGNFPFVLAVTGTETSGTDPNKTLTATSSLTVRLEVLKNPIIPK